MRFHLCNIEPQGFPFGHFLDDFCRLVAVSLESLGHTCSMGVNQLEPDRMNIIFGGHLLNSIDQVESIAGACTYIAIQHEILNADGVNLSRDLNQFQSVYVPFLNRAHAVWEGIQRNLTPLARLGIRAAFFRGGWHPAMAEVVAKRERDIDFLFYGSMTPHRTELLQRLAERGHQVVAVFDPRSTYRNDLIARTRVALAPVQGPGMNHFACGRVCYLLNNRSLVVVERCEDDQWLEHCFVPATADTWADICEQTLQRYDREDLREEFCARFRELPFTNEVERMLDETVARKVA